MYVLLWFEQCPLRFRFTGQMASVAAFSGSLSRAEVLEVYAVMATPACMLVAPSAADKTNFVGGGDGSQLPSQTPLATPFSVLHALITGGDSASGRYGALETSASCFQVFSPAFTAALLAHSPEYL